jgi:hypothetical protein
MRQMTDGIPSPRRAFVDSLPTKGFGVVVPLAAERVLVEVADIVGLGT